MNAGRATRPKTCFWMPAFGVVVGGELDGHRYHFHGFTVEAGVLMVDATVTRPNWPFPRRMLMAPGQYHDLVAVTGERARRIPADDLVVEAFAKSHEASNDGQRYAAAGPITMQEEDVHVG